MPRKPINCTPDEIESYNRYYRMYNKARYQNDATYKEAQKEKSRLAYIKKKEQKINNLNIVNLNDN
jgi:hypothetical protein